MAEITERLRNISRGDHERGCQGREYVCSCGYDETIWKTAEEAADEIERLTAQIERFRSERSYVVGFNDGWEEAMEQATAADLRAGERMMAPAETQLHAIVDAWEALTGGRQVRNKDVEAWLAKDMTPAINAIRGFLRRPKPDDTLTPSTGEGGE